jgi:hypothetical protein
MTGRAAWWRRRFLVCVLALTAAIGTSSASNIRSLAAQPYPNRLSDAEFWRLVSEFSESGGSFLSDNFVSNEDRFQDVIPRLLDQQDGRGGVYLGVGPDQNFTYIVALKPTVAFIVDIRRQNLVQHLLYKALIEMSKDRAEFLSRLFSRPRPKVDPHAKPSDLIVAFGATEGTESLYLQNLSTVVKRLTRDHRFALTPDDLISLNYVYRTFYREGPDIHYSVASYPTLKFPTFGEIAQETDGAGTARGYLASEENFNVLKDIEQRNLIVPVVGDFAGDKALPAVARYLKHHDLRVSAFYVSNVEGYLFNPQRAYQRFYAHLDLLPTDSRSTLIRSYQIVARRTLRPELAIVLDPIQDFVRAVKEGNIASYRDVIGRPE